MNKNRKIKNKIINSSQFIQMTMTMYDHRQYTTTVNAYTYMQTQAKGNKVY